MVGKPYIFSSSPQVMSLCIVPSHVILAVFLSIFPLIGDSGSIWTAGCPGTINAHNEHVNIVGLTGYFEFAAKFIPSDPSLPMYLTSNG